MNKCKCSQLFPFLCLWISLTLSLSVCPSVISKILNSPSQSLLLYSPQFSSSFPSSVLLSSPLLSSLVLQTDKYSDKYRLNIFKQKFLLNFLPITPKELSLWWQKGGALPTSGFNDWMNATPKRFLHVCMCVYCCFWYTNNKAVGEKSTGKWTKTICVSAYECVHTGVTDSEIQNEAESEQRKTGMCWCVSSGKLWEKSY